MNKNKVPYFFNSFEVKTIFEVFSKDSTNIYIVGGAVRDYLLNNDICDIDFSIDTDIHSVIKTIEKWNKKASSNKKIDYKPTGISYGTITLIIGKKTFEITSFREDLNCLGRHSDIKFTKDISIDAKRRDFYINAIYMDKNGKVIDPLGYALKDIEERHVRFIGKPSVRIREDFLRILRYFRFCSSVSNGNINKEILRVIKNNYICLSYISKARLRDEFFKILKTKKSLKVLRIMQRTGVLGIILPTRKTLIPYLNYLKYSVVNKKMNILENNGSIYKVFDQRFGLNLNSISDKNQKKILLKHYKTLVLFSKLLKGFDKEEKINLYKYLEIAKKDRKILDIMDNTKL